MFFELVATFAAGISAAGLALIANHLTGGRLPRWFLPLAAGGAMRIGTAAAAGAVSLAYPDWNGAVLGVAAWTLSYAAESAITGWRLRRLGWYVDAERYGGRI